MSPLNITINPGPSTPSSIETHELFFAHRALALLKTRLGSQGIMDLLAPDIDAADAYFERMVHDSAGKFHLATITLNATGLYAQDLLGWYKAHCDQQELMQAAHPEHYLNSAGPILETFGEHPTFFTLELTPEPSECCVRNRDAEVYPMALCGSARLRSGTVIGYACHQFREYDEGESEGVGFEVVFGAWLPASCGEEVVETHRRHMAVEWSNWIRAAYEDRRSRVLA